MDIDKIVDEVVRRLMILIKEEQAGSGFSEIDVVSSATVTTPCCDKATPKKKLITETEAMNIATGSKVSFAKGTIVTPLARDAFKQRGITIEFL